MNTNTSHMTVHALIPVHNNLEYTLNCVRDLKKQTYGPLKIVIVDDGSDDKSMAVIESRKKSLIAR